MAGIAHSDNGKISRDKAKLYYEVNTKLTIKTAMKAKNAGVKQFIFMSSAIVYGDSAPIGDKKAHFSALTPNWIINVDKANYKSVRKAIRIVEMMHRIMFKKCEREVILWE